MFEIKKANESTALIASYDRPAEQPSGVGPAERRAARLTALALKAMAQSKPTQDQQRQNA